MIASALESIEGFRDKWPFAARYARVNGWRMHYVDEGAGDPILLLHGNPTWGYLYRDVIPPLVSAGYRVIVPDMIGFGLSEKPAREQAHSLDAHIANLTGLLRQLDLQRLTVVCHDWGGPTGLGFAMSNPARVRALTVMSTWAWPTPPAEFHTRLFPWRMMHAPLVGPYLLGRHNVLARRGVYLSVVGRDKFRREAQAAYEAVLPDAETRLLTWVWPRWIPLEDTARAQARFAWLEAEGEIQIADADHLGTRGRGVRRRDLRRTIQAPPAACRVAAHGDRPALPAGGFRCRDRPADRRLPRQAGRHVMANVAIIPGLSPKAPAMRWR
jgi:pimeloyl-ACP methyl ester carboxylesterase